MKGAIIILALLAGCSIPAFSQQSFTGSNSCVLRIQTERKEYQFVTKEMSARLNDAMDRFEFLIPVRSLKSQVDSSDVSFIKSFADGNAVIIINASLPDDKDAELDLSYFKGNRSVSLASELKIGVFTFADDIDFNGMLMGSNQSMAFDFQIFLNTRAMPLQKVNNEKLLEIELGAKGDKIIGLTFN